MHETLTECSRDVDIRFLGVRAGDAAFRIQIRAFLEPSGFVLGSGVDLSALI